MHGVSSVTASGATGFSRATTAMAAAAAQINEVGQAGVTVSLSEAAQSALDGSPQPNLENGIVALHSSKYQALANLGTIRAGNAMFDELLNTVNGVR